MRLRDLVNKDWDEMPYAISYKGVIYYLDKEKEVYSCSVLDYSYCNQLMVGVGRMDDEIGVLQWFPDNIDYEQYHIDSKDVNVIFKRYYDDWSNVIKEELSGFYYGEPSMELLMKFKDKGVVNYE